MRQLIIFFFIPLLVGCAQWTEEEVPRGKVDFSGLQVEVFSNQLPEARVKEASEWQHIFPEHAQIEIIETNTNDRYFLDFDPNDFFQSYQIELPYGRYRFTTVVEGEVAEAYLPFEAEGDFILEADRIDIVLEASTDYGLLTVESRYVEEASFIRGSETYEFHPLPSSELLYLYVRGGLEGLLSYQKNLADEGAGEFILTTESNVHLHFYMEIEVGNVNYTGLQLGEFSYSETFIPVGGTDLRYVYDNDGNAYKVVKIGEQYWMAENLRSTTYCNGDEIPYLEAGEDWDGEPDGVWTYFANDPKYARPYGNYYNASAAIEERNICPCGWKVPEREDWEILYETVGGRETAGAVLRATGTDHWHAPNALATDDFKFGMIGGGDIIVGGSLYSIMERYFYRFHENGSYWTSTLYPFDTGQTQPDHPAFVSFSVFATYTNVNRTDAWFYANDDVVGNGHPVRCVKE